MGVLSISFAQSQAISERIKAEINENQSDSKGQLINNRGARNRQSSNYQNTPTINWSKSFGGSGFDKITDSFVDDIGQTYITGFFSGDVSIAGNEFSSTGYSDGFVAKFSSSGAYEWCVTLPASSKNIVESLGMHVDDVGNVFATGRFTDTINFGGTVLTSSTEESLFFVKINSSGSLKIVNKYEDARGLNISTDASNNIYIVGSTEPTSQPQHASVLLKYDNSGSILFNQPHDEGYSDLVIDATGVYLAGTWHDSDAVLDNDVSLVYDIDNVQYYFAFIAKMDLSGDFLWASVAKHVAESNRGTSKSVSIDSDDAGNLYLGGTFQNDIVLGSTIINSNYGKGAFIAKVNSSGTILSGQNTEMIEGSGKISADGNANLYAFDGNEFVKYNSSLEEQSRGTLTWESLASVNNSGTKAIVSGLETQSMRIRQIDLSNNSEIFEVSISGTTAASTVLATEMDRGGNVYTVGYTWAKTSILGEEIEKGFFLSKQNSQGALIWIKNFKCTPKQISNGEVGNKLSLSRDQSSLYVLLSYSEHIELPDGSMYNTSSESTIILKFKLDGSFEFAINEKLKTYGAQIKTDYDGNLLFSGEVNSYVDLLAGKKFNELGDGSLFLVKYNSTGQTSFVKNIGESGSNYNLLVDADSDNNIYLNTEFGASNLTVNGVSVLNPAEGEGNNIVIKMNSSGEVLWAKANGGDKNPESFDEYYTWTSGIAVAPNGNFYIKGALGKEAYFDGIHLENPDHRYNKFIAKFDQDGETLWARSISQTSGSQFCYDYNEFEIDALGNVYFGAQYQYTFTFHDGTKLVSDDKKNLFIAKYTNDGALDWVKSFISGEYSNSDIITGIAVNQNQQVVIGGRFDQSITSDDVSMSASLINHGFLISLEDPTAHSEPLEIDQQTVKPQYSIFPNPVDETLRIYGVGMTSLWAIELFNVSGKQVESLQRPTSNGEKLELDVSKLKTGLYILRIKSSSENWSQRFIKK